ncbi:MAG: hypothetical protein Greene041619_45 [Candidatus Peregrinibacteria bacterium Greene0416_19]|nr:MAG: hypothetical protein Greene041619_45 [Candidatus Peregrinibacteria bacterium Greene0416_19]
MIHHRWFPSGFVLACCAILIALWLPLIRYPVVSDTLNYALLGQSLWEHGTYMLNGVPWSKHLPLHAILSYPLVKVFGLHLGMHIASLLGGFGVLLGTYLVLQRTVGRSAALLTVLLVLLHPGFVLMSALGSADLLFTTLLLLSLAFYLEADKDERWYVLAGLAAGLACLTRYNGAPLFLLFLGYTYWKRRAHLRSHWFWSGIVLGSAVFSLWLVRNMVTFGNPLASGYRDELAQEAPSIIGQFLSNVLYYGNPVHNVFPFLFIFAAAGVILHARRQPFLFLAMLTAWVVSAVWWVQAIRFFFPGYPLLQAFAALALLDLWRRWKAIPWLMGLVAVVGMSVQAFSLCIYTYGACNAWFDRTVGLLPVNMGLTSEGFYAWGLARDYLNAHAPKGATVYYEFIEDTGGHFRSDFRMTSDQSDCEAYRITQRPEDSEEIVFRTEAAPVTYVVERVCTSP